MRFLGDPSPETGFGSTSLLLWGHRGGAQGEDEDDDDNDVDDEDGDDDVFSSNGVQVSGVITYDECTVNFSDMMNKVI